VNDNVEEMSAEKLVRAREERTSYGSAHCAAQEKNSH